MRCLRYRIRTYMMIVVLLAVVLGLIAIAWRSADIHIHDTYFTLGGNR
jgi:hypothetical protein